MLMKGIKDGPGDEETGHVRGLDTQYRKDADSPQSDPGYIHSNRNYDRILHKINKLDLKFMERLRN